MDCPNCGSNSIAWINGSLEFQDYFFDEENPWYMGDSYSVDNYRCDECEYTFSESKDECNNQD